MASEGLFGTLYEEAQALMQQAEGQEPQAASELCRRAKELASQAYDLAAGFEERQRSLDVQRQAAKKLNDEGEVKRLQKLLAQVVTEHSAFKAEVEAKSKHIVTDQKQDLP